MKYKIGDIVVIRTFITQKEGSTYRVDKTETDIKGKTLPIIGINTNNDAYHFEGYKNLFEHMIDHEKTALINKNIQYEIY